MSLRFGNRHYEGLERGLDGGEVGMGRAGIRYKKDLRERVLGETTGIIKVRGRCL